jgi:hypothetical protein
MSAFTLSPATCPIRSYMISTLPVYEMVEVLWCGAVNGVGPDAVPSVDSDVFVEPEAPEGPEGPGGGGLGLEGPGSNDGSSVTTLSLLQLMIVVGH